MRFRAAMRWTDDATWQRQPADTVARWLAYYEIEEQEGVHRDGHRG